MKRLAISLILVVALLASAGMQYVARQQRIDALFSGPYRPVQASAARLTGLPSYALALLLGGLRGPLVMVLWSTSEAQKQQRDLQDFDTKIELIRMLQPEFDSVHLFQLWNKAYNISAQMASLSNKYSTILDALDYGERTDRERPSNINILAGIAQLYFDKLGLSAEQEYYRRRVRQETQWREIDERRDAADFRRTRLDPKLGPDGNILPELLRPIAARPADLQPDEPWNTGAELQYLEQYQPFPHGLSTFALAYNYYQRAQVLQETGGQTHIQLSDLVIDSRPALALRNWAEEEWLRARRAEAQLFGIDIPAERLELENVTADVPLTAELKNPQWFDEAVYSYAMTARLAEDAIASYERHLRGYQTNFFTYQSHISHMRSIGALAAGDAAYLRAIRAQGPDREALTRTAADHYRDAIVASQRIVLRHYVPDPVRDGAMPAGVLAADIDKLTPAQLDAAYDKAIQLLPQFQQWDMHGEDRAEYVTYVNRAETRLKNLGVAAVTLRN